MLLRLLTLCCALQGLPLPARGTGTGNDTGVNAVAASQNKTIRLLVLLPERSGDKKFPFGAEMCGSAGESSAIINFFFSIYILIWRTTVVDVSFLK